MQDIYVNAFHNPYYFIFKRPRMKKTTAYIPVSVDDELPSENDYNQGYTIDVLAYGSKTSLPIRGYFGINTRKFFPFHYPTVEHNYITHWLRPVENVYVMDEAAIIELMAFTISKQSMKSYDHCRRMAKEYFEITTKK